MKPYTANTNAGRTKARDDIHRGTADGGNTNRMATAKSQRKAARRWTHVEPSSECDPTDLTVTELALFKGASCLVGVVSGVLCTYTVNGIRAGQDRLAGSRLFMAPKKIKLWHRIYRTPYNGYATITMGSDPTSTTLLTTELEKHDWVNEWTLIEVDD